ncbi:MAG: hypothetical protein HY592_01565 [Candidatus Omnitrophica bacterium]|nr:hypothetical protein [Candidatus Omnitrophota bacterium]
MPTTTLTEQIKILVELQKIDGEAYRLKKERDAQPSLQKELEGGFEKKKKGLKAAEEELKTAQLRQKEREIELQTKEDKTKKLQGQLYQLKSNKEYSAMEFEIKGLKADQSVLEEEILKILDTVEEVRGRVAREKESLAQEEKKFKTELDELTKKTQELTAEIAASDEKRKSYTPNIDPKLLSQYEKILKGREGIAIVPVMGNACGGCHLGLPPQTVHEIRLQEKLMVCESCARILYWPL